MAGGFIDASSLVFAYIGAAIILYGGAITVIKTLSLISPLLQANLFPFTI